MSTTYVIFCQSHDDPVLGLQICDWIHTNLVRVYRNRLGTAVFEWVGSNIPFDLDEVRRHYPICKFADIDTDRYRATIPFPDRVHD